MITPPHREILKPYACCLKPRVEGLIFQKPL
jgi:hypothetical protein